MEEVFSESVLAEVSSMSCPTFRIIIYDNDIKNSSDNNIKKPDNNFKNIADDNFKNTSDNNFKKIL